MPQSRILESPFHRDASPYDELNVVRFAVKDLIHRRIIRIYDFYRVSVGVPIPTERHWTDFVPFNFNSLAARGGHLNSKIKPIVLHVSAKSSKIKYEEIERLFVR